MCLVAALAAPDEAAQSQTYRAPKARRHFVSVTYETQFVHPYGFDKHPLSELLGQPVDEVHLESYQYRTRDQQDTQGQYCPGHGKARSHRAKSML